MLCAAESRPSGWSEPLSMLIRPLRALKCACTWLARECYRGLQHRHARGRVALPNHATSAMGERDRLDHSLRQSHSLP